MEFIDARDIFVHDFIVEHYISDNNGIENT